MTDEEREILESLKAGGKKKPSVIGADDSRQFKAGRSGIAAHCPVCKYWFEVDENGVLKHMLRKTSRALDRKGVRICRQWIESNWGTRLNRLTKNPSMSSRSLGRIYQSGVSRGMKFTSKAAQREGHHAHMIIAWNDSDSFGENYMCIPIGEFFNVFRALCDDSPEFFRRAKLAMDTSLKGANRSPGGADEQKELEQAFDESTAVRL